MQQAEALDLNNKRPRDEDAETEGGPDKKRASAGTLEGAEGAQAVDPLGVGVSQGNAVCGCQGSGGGGGGRSRTPY